MPNPLKLMMATAGVPVVTGGYELWAWGSGTAGGLGLGDTTNRSSPVQIGSDNDWMLCGAARERGAATKNNGTLWSWGYNNNGQLGIGNTTNVSSPVQVGTDTDWPTERTAQQFMIIGYENSAVIKADGTLWTWGRGGNGENGRGNTDQVTTPLQVGSLSNWKTLSSIGSHNGVLATKTDGTLWAWGYNNYGQLGLGDTTSYSSPVQVGSLTNWLNVSMGGEAGQGVTGATKTDGTFWTWGRGAQGYRAQGSDKTDVSSPVQVGSLTNWLQPIFKRQNMGAIKTDGTMWSWGVGGIRSGIGSGGALSSPVQVGTRTDWIFRDQSYATGFALTDSGTLWAWGSNSTGALGNNSTTNVSTPVQVGSDTDWVQVATSTQSGGHVIALKGE